jgi:polar amino acid transport system substrate-binding protein
MKTFFTISLTFAALLNITSFVLASSIPEIRKSGTLRVGLESGFIPFEMVTKKGKWVGFDVQMITEFAQSLGVKPQFIDTKWDGIIPAMVANKFDVIASGMSITSERAKVVQFSQPYYQAGLVGLINRSRHGIINRLADLDNKKYSIALKTGTTGDTFATKNIKHATLKRFDTESDCANAVALGKVDAFIYDKPFNDIFAARNAAKVFVLPELLNSEFIGVAFRRNDVDLLREFDSFLAKWRSSGKYQTVYNFYFKEMGWIKDFPDLK